MIRELNPYLLYPNTDKSSTVLLKKQVGTATLKNSLATWIPPNPVTSNPRILPKCVYICTAKGQKCLEQCYL